MTSSVGDAKKPRRELRKLAWPLLLVRIVALILAVQTSNVAHAAIDVASAAFGYVAEHDDCTRDCDDDLCPPGCPKCHCADARLNVLPPELLTLQTPHARVETAWSQSPTTEEPPAPPLSSVYRPPKRTHVFG